MRRLVVCLLFVTVGLFGADKTFTGTGNFGDASKWDSSTLPAAGDNLSIDGVCTHTENAASVYGAVTIVATRTMDLATYSMSCGVASVAGTIKIGVSSGSGFVCSGFTASTGSKMDLQTASKITNHGAAYIAISVFTNEYRGTYVQAGSGACYIGHTNYFYSYTLDAGKIITASGILYLSYYNTHDTTINGIINALPYIGGRELTIGANADFWGITQTFATPSGTAFSFTNNKTGAFSLGTGGIILNCAAMSGVDNHYLSLNAPNVNAYVSSGSGSILTLIFTAGTLTCKSLRYGGSFGPHDELRIRNDINNPNFVVSELIDLNAPAVTAMVYTAGTGTWTLNGTSGTHNIDFGANDPAVGDVIIAGGSAVKTILTNFSPRTVTVTSGSFDIGTCTVTTGSVSVASGAILKLGASTGSGLVASGITFAEYALMTGSSISGKINNYGNFTCNNNTFIGQYTQQANGTWLNGNGFYNFDIFTIPVGVTLSSEGVFGTKYGGILFLLGTITTAYGTSIISHGGWRIGTSGDIAGSSSIAAYMFSYSTMQTSRTTPLSYSGTFTNIVNYADRAYVALDFSNADICIMNQFANSAIAIGIGPHLKAKSIVIDTASGGSQEINHSVDNPSWTISGSITTLNGGALTWSRGSGTINLIASGTGTDTINFGSNPLLEAVVVAATSDTKNIVNNFRTLSFNGTGGTVQSSVEGTRRTIGTQSKGAAVNMIFQDISMGAKNMLNAKVGCSNKGNCLGIVFKDTAR